MSQKIVILDYSTGTVYIRSIAEEVDPEDVLDDLGLKLSECEWMVSDNLKIDL